MITDEICRALTDHNSASQKDKTPSVSGSDIFWDAFEPDTSKLQSKSSILSFADIASNSDSGYWTDNDPTAWIPHNDYPAIPGSSHKESHLTAFATVNDKQNLLPHQASFNMFDATTTSLEDRSVEDVQEIALAQQNLPGLSDDHLNTTYPPPLTESPDALLMNPSIGNSYEALMSSQDPFMGSWASEKAHHLFDDYGWVLHHVENL